MKPRLAVEGVSYYYNSDAEALCLFMHHRADPLKRSKEFRHLIAADFPPLGEADPRCREEYDMDFDAARGKLIYYGWSPSWNLVKPFDPLTRGYTDWHLYADYGDQSCFHIYATNPRTGYSVGVEELYPYKETTATMQQLIYDCFAKHRGLHVGSFRINDYLKSCGGDTHGGSIAREFAEGALGISFATKGQRGPQGEALDNKDRGWRRSNEFLRPGFWHCGIRWYPKDEHAAPMMAGKCEKCGAGPFNARPLLTFMEGRFPNLVRTIGHIEKVAPPTGEVELDKEKRGQEDHSSDVMRYFVQAGARIQEPSKYAETDILERPVSALDRGERVDRILAEKFRDQQQRLEAEGLNEREAAFMVAAGDEGAMQLVSGFDPDGEGLGIYDEDDSL